MVKTISIEQYNELDTYGYNITASEQFLDNGFELTFCLDWDSEHFYLTAYPSDSDRDRQFCIENGYDTDSCDYNEKWCNDFACKVCDTLDEVNEFVIENLACGEQIKFWEDEYGYNGGY